MNKARTTRKYSRRKYTRRKSKKKTKRKLRGGMLAADAAAFAAAVGHGGNQDEKVSRGKGDFSDDESSDEDLFRSVVGTEAGTEKGVVTQVLEQPDLSGQGNGSGGAEEEGDGGPEPEPEAILQRSRSHKIPLPEPRRRFSPGNLFIRGKADQGEYDAALIDEKDNDRDVFNSSDDEIRIELLAMPDGTLFEYFTSREGSHNSRIVNALAAMANVKIGKKEGDQISPCRKNEETGGYEQIEGATKIPFDGKFIDENHIIIIDADFRLQTMFIGKRYLFSVMGSNLQFAFSDFNHENMQLIKTTTRGAVGWSSEQQYILSLGEGLPTLTFHWYQIDNLIREMKVLVGEEVDEDCRVKITGAIDLHEKYKTTWSPTNAGLRMESLARGSASVLGTAVSGVLGTAAEASAKVAAAMTPQLLQDAGTAAAGMVSTIAATAPAIPGREEKTVQLESNDDIEHPTNSLTKFILGLLLRLIRCGYLEQVLSNLGVSTNEGEASIITKQNFAAALISKAVGKDNIVEATVDTSMGVGRATWYGAADFVSNLLQKMGATQLEKLRTELGKELLADRMHEWKRENQSQFKARAFQYAAGAAAGIAEYLQWETARFSLRVAEGVAKATVVAHESGLKDVASAAGKVKNAFVPTMYAAHATHTRVILTNAIKSAGFWSTIRSLATLKLSKDFINHIKAGREARELYNSLCAELVNCTPDSEDMSGVEKDSVEVRRTIKLMEMQAAMSAEQRKEFVGKVMRYGNYTGNPQIQQMLQNSVAALGDAGAAAAAAALGDAGAAAALEDAGAGEEIN